MHKLLFDQNLSYKLVEYIKEIFPESTHVSFIKLDTSEDLVLWQYAKDHGYHIVTKDTDFNDISALYGFPPKIIRINIGNTSTKTIVKFLENKIDFIKSFLDNEYVGYLEID